MRTRPLSRACAAAMAVLLFAAAPVRADTPASDVVVVETCPADAATVDREDAATVTRALADLQSGGYPALRPHVPALRRVLDRAPACYPLFERRGDTIIAREFGSDSTPAVTLALLLNATVEQKSVAVENGDNVYGLASFMLGGNAVEDKDHAAAIGFLNRGLSLQPRNQILVSEKVAALQGLDRHADAQTLIQAALDDPTQALTLNRARFLRMSGVTLIDLGRLNEAESALKESDRLDPNNPATLNELAYIAQLRAGGPQVPLEIKPVQSPRD